MAQITANQGRAQVPVPTQGYDAQIDGGTALAAAVNNAFATLSNNLVGRWFANTTVNNNIATTFTHNFGQALTSLKVLIFESGALITQATQATHYTIAQVDTNNISITNVSGGSITFQVYILAFPLGVTSADLDASINATITSLQFTNGLSATEISTPVTPASGIMKLYPKSDNNWYQLDPNGVESLLGSGSSGGINYISNSNFNNGSVTGWATYSNTAQSTPVTGTGGSPTISFVASSSSPGRGSYSALLTKGASNLQGQGISYDFTIASNDTSRTLQLTFDSIVSSGLVSGDIGIYIYDKTNSTLISPSQVSLPTGTSSQYSIAFQSTTSTSYRVIFHIATTSAVAYTVKFNQFSISPIIRPVISGIADTSTLFTPTSSWATNTTHTGIYGRRGDRAIGQIKLSLSGAPTSATLTNISLPFTIDTTKILSATTAGVALPQCSVTIKSAGSVYTSSSVWYVTNTTIQPTYDNGSGIATAITQAAPGTFASGDYIQIDFDLPVVNFSSNTTLASSTGAIEYQSNSSSTDADDTTSFVAGASGSVGILRTTALTALRKKRIQFSTPIQPTDRIQMELYNPTNGMWSPDNPLFSFASGVYTGRATNIISSGSVGAGYSILPVSSTQVDVVFNQYAGYLLTPAVVDWNSTNILSGVKWRLAKYSSIGGAELAPATITSQGTVAYSQTISSGIVAANFTGFGTPSPVNIFMRREGDSLILSGGFTSSANTGVTAKMLLPSVNGTALTIDTTKILAKSTNDCHVLGHGYINQAGTGAFLGYNITFLADSTDNTSIYFSTNHNSNIPTQPATGTNLSTGLYRISELKIPIVGWS